MWLDSTLLALGLGRGPYLDNIPIPDNISIPSLFCLSVSSFVYSVCLPVSGRWRSEDIYSFLTQGTLCSQLVGLMDSHLLSHAVVTVG